MIQLVKSMESFRESYGEYDESLHHFIARMRWHVILLDYLAFATIIVVIVLFVTDGRHHKWNFGICHLIHRVHEAGMLFALIIVMFRPERKEGKQSMESGRELSLQHSYSGASQASQISTSVLIK
mmetsp:Transcript_10610/g.14526  ORF Transcript_10610/g.14526 Transcript_10610/m.14526 type:complete len:125 (+) Transcript_10610:370-744(+)